MTAAGDRYDAAVRAVWAQIPRELGQREAWQLAEPGMRAAQQALDAELAARQFPAPAPDAVDPETARCQRAVYGAARTTDAESPYFRALAAARAEGGRTAQQVITAQADAGMGADRVEASAERVLGDRYTEGGDQAAAFYDGYDAAAATLTRELREMEAGQ